MTHSSDPLREAVRRAVHSYGIARVAHLVDEPPDTLRHYLASGEVGRDVRARLEEWLGPTATGLKEGPGPYRGSGS